MEIDEDEYFEDLLGKECNAKRKNKTGGCGKNECEEACQKIGIALKKTQELYNTAIASDLKHNFCFWVIEFALFGFYVHFLLEAVYKYNYRNDDSFLLITFLLSLFGLFIAIIYNYISLNSKTWQKNWEKHIHILEDYDITGKLHNFAFTPKTFFSVSGIDRTIILIIKVAWIFFALLSSTFLILEIDEPWPVALFPLVVIFYFVSDYTIHSKLNSKTLGKE